MSLDDLQARQRTVLARENLLSLVMALDCLRRAHAVAAVPAKADGFEHPLCLRLSAIGSYLMARHQRML